MENQVQYNLPETSSTSHSLSNADHINQLPDDQTQPSHNEIMIVNSLFKEHGNTMNVIFKEIQDSLIIGLLFIVFSLPQIDEIIKKTLPMADKSIYILLFVKAILVSALFWLIKHFYLSRKNS
jgi:hypothetical protein